MIDAHTDINSPKIKELGNLHGCPLSFAMGIDAESYPQTFNWVPQNLNPNKITYIGLRDIDESEKKILVKHNIAAFSMNRIEKYGIGKVLEMALDKINPKRTFPIHVFYDIDAPDPIYVPVTGVRVEGGA